jgi:phenylacetic acid degradation operon negative regulatory protein
VSPDADAGTPEPGTDVPVLQIQELILTLVGEYVAPGAPIWSGGLVRLLDELGFSAAASRIALGRVVSRGLLDRTKDGRRVYYRATDRLTEVLTEGHRQTFWFRYPAEDWDGQWTLVWYAIPEEHLLARRRLSRRLGFLGFGALQDGTWIAPRDREAEVHDLVRRLGIEPYVVVFVGAPPGWVEGSQVFARGWDLDELEQRYAAFVAEFAPYRRKGVRSKLTPRDAFVARTRVLESFRQLAPLDPKLPEEFLRRRWKRQQAIECFDEVEAALRPAAAEYVDALTDPDR